METLRAKSVDIPGIEIANALDLTPQLEFPPTYSEFLLDFDLKQTTASRFGVELSNAKGERYRIGYDAVTKQYFSDRTQAGDHTFSDKFATGPHAAPRTAKTPTLRLHLFFDAASAELFADDGATTLTELYFPSEDFSQVKVFAEGGKAQLVKANAWQLQGIWK